MSRIVKMLVMALSVLALAAVTASAAFATEAPYYKVGGARLGATESAEVTLTGKGNQVLKAGTITITCEKLTAKSGLILGSAAGEPGTSSGVLEYSGCTVAGNGEKCVVTSVAGAKDKKVTTNSLKDELAYAKSPVEKNVADVDIFKPATGSVFVTLKFEAEAGGKCTNATGTVEGSIATEVLNSKSEVVGVEKNEVEEEFGFVKTGPKEACQVKAGVLQACIKPSLKAFGLGATYEGTSEAKLTKGGKFGVFNK